MRNKYYVEAVRLEERCGGRGRWCGIRVLGAGRRHACLAALPEK